MNKEILLTDGDIQSSTPLALEINRAIKSLTEEVESQLNDLNIFIKSNGVNATPTDYFNWKFFKYEVGNEDPLMFKIVNAILNFKSNKISEKELKENLFEEIENEFSYVSFELTKDFYIGWYFLKYTDL